jgi:hypothetical protein
MNAAVAAIPAPAAPKVRKAPLRDTFAVLPAADRTLYLLI